MTNGNGTEADGAAFEAAQPETDDVATLASAPDVLAQLEAEKADLRDRLMRSLADMENLRRRTEREVADARTYAVTTFARDMLTVADNIRRALEAVSRDGPDFPVLKPLVEGIELTERDLASTLARHGVKLLEPTGQKFDPNMHQAMFELPSDEVPGGTVLQVVQSGYEIGGRVLRPALVGVSKSLAKARDAEPGGASSAA